MSEKKTEVVNMNTGLVRFSYPHLWEPAAMEGATKKKYSVVLLIPKSDTATVKLINEKVKLATANGLKKTLGGKSLPTDKHPLRDGDLEKADKDATFKDHWFMTASCDGDKTPPGIVDRDRRPITVQSEFYAGCYGRANVNFSAYNKAGNRGVGCYLNHVQKIKDGEPLSARISVDAAFDDDFEMPADDNDEL